MGRQALFRLGRDAPGRYKVWAERLGELEAARTIGQLLDRYALEVIPTKAPKTQAGNNRALPTLRAVFGHLPLTPFKPRLVYQYVDRRGAKIAAHREIEVLSHAFTKAVEWGYIDRHPFKGEVRLEGEAPRTRYVEDWEVVEALALKPRRKAGSVLAVQAYIRMKLLTGMRRGDLLRLRPAHDCKEDGIHVQPRKTAKNDRQAARNRVVGGATRRGGDGARGPPCRHRAVPLLHTPWRVLREAGRQRERVGLDVGPLHGSAARRNEGRGAVHRARSAARSARATRGAWSTPARSSRTPSAHHGEGLSAPAGACKTAPVKAHE